MSVNNDVGLWEGEQIAFLKLGKLNYAFDR